MDYSYQNYRDNEINLPKMLSDCLWIIVKAVVFTLALLVLFGLVFGYKPYLVISGSMTPTLIENRDIVIVKKMNYNDYKIGDIITFTKDDGVTMCTHRIIDFEVDEHNKRIGINTQGDANNSPDNYHLTDDQIVGKVVAIYREWGAVYLFIRNNLYFCIALVLTIYMGVTLLEANYDYLKKPVKFE